MKPYKILHIPSGEYIVHVIFEGICESRKITYWMRNKTRHFGKSTEIFHSPVDEHRLVCNITADLNLQDGIFVSMDEFEIIYV